MTTIAYDYDKQQIAVDSRTTANGLIANDHTDKTVINELGTWILCGTCHKIPTLVNCVLGDHFEDTHRYRDVGGFLIRDGKVYEVFIDEGYYAEELLTYSMTLGSGGEFALAALDMGKSAQEAVEYAITRDSSTGGEVHVINVADVVS